MSVELYGVDKVMSALKKLDPVVDKEVKKELSAAAGQVVGLARSFVDPQGLSGWASWRGGYSATSISAGIKVKRGGRRKRGHVTSNYIGVANTSAAGAIWEVAGRKSAGNPPGPGPGRNGARSKGNGASMVAAMNARGGKASRTVWAAVDESAGGAAVQRIEAALSRALATVQVRMNRPSKGM